MNLDGLRRVIDRGGAHTFVYKLDRTQSHIYELIECNSLEFCACHSPLTITFTIILSSTFLLGSIYFALLVVDIVALVVTGWLGFQTRDSKM